MYISLRDILDGKIKIYMKGEKCFHELVFVLEEKQRPFTSKRKFHNGTCHRENIVLLNL